MQLRSWLFAVMILGVSVSSHGARCTIYFLEYHNQYFYAIRDYTDHERWYIFNDRFSFKTIPKMADVFDNSRGYETNYLQILDGIETPVLFSILTATECDEIPEQFQSEIERVFSCQKGQKH